MKIKYQYRNKYGYPLVSLVIDTEARTAILYKGCSAPVDKYKKRGKGEIYATYTTYRDQLRFTSEER